MPTVAHFIYIPMILMVGIVLGYILAHQSQKERWAVKEARRKRHQNALHNKPDLEQEPSTVLSHPSPSSDGV